jgi:hypothetical protein
LAGLTSKEFFSRKKKEAPNLRMQRKRKELLQKLMTGPLL